MLTNSSFVNLPLGIIIVTCHPIVRSHSLLDIVSSFELGSDFLLW